MEDKAADGPREPLTEQPRRASGPAMGVMSKSDSTVRTAASTATKPALL